MSKAQVSVTGALTSKLFSKRIAAGYQYAFGAVLITSLPSAWTITSCS